MSKRTLLFLAAAATTGLAVATVQTADAAVCRPRLSGAGEGQGILGKGTQNARARATAEWESKAKSRYGSRFASLSKASGVTWNCKSTIVKATCQVSARPCR